MEGSVNVGPWGGKGGNHWAYVPINGAISHISITYDDFIRSINFRSQDVNGNLDHSEKFGDQDGSKRDEIDIDIEVEKLNSVSGTVDTFDSSMIVTSLSFSTDNNKSYGPFGSLQGTTFSLSVKDDRIAGFYGRSTWCLNTFGVHLKIAMSELVGPWGGQGGAPSTYTPNGIISRISITHDDAIHSIGFRTQDEKDDSYHPNMFGVTDGSTIDEVSIDTMAGEKLLSISGTYGNYTSATTVVTSLSFMTNKNRSFGPFGTFCGTAFSFAATKNDFITGFHGRSGRLLDAIGVYHNPRTRLVIGAWGGPSGEAWNYEAKGVISRISITHDNVIHSICFTSHDKKGNVDHSNKFGKEDGTKRDEIDIEFMIEKLSTISGTIGTYNSSLVITSLSFATNTKKSYGPYGIENGTAFSFPAKDGFFSGFHGRCSSCLNAIGVYLKPSFIYSDGDLVEQMGLYTKPLFD